MPYAGRYDHLDDKALVARFHQADLAEQKTLFAAVCQRHLRTVTGFCAGQLNERDSSSDAAHDAFLAGFESLRRGTVPDALLPWLIGIARYRCLEYLRGPSPDGRRRGSLDELSRDGKVDPENGKAAEEVENLSRRRRAEVDRLLDTVARTLTAKQQELFALSIREGLAGEALGRRIGKTSAQASREAYQLGALLDEGFGALVLAREGRPYCAELAAILDSAAAKDGAVFTAALRTRIVHHFGTCRTCDDCATCAEQRRRLVAPLAPVLIPILVLAPTRDRIEQSVERVARSTPLPPAPPGPRPRRSPALLILPLLVVIAIVAGVFAATRDSDAAVLPVSLAGTWQLEPFNVPGGTPSQRNPQWSFTGACESADDCAFSWLPLISTTTFESMFTPDFRQSAKQQVPAGLPQNIAADLLVRPVPPGNFYAGKATAQYGIFDEQNQSFATGQETVILTIQVLDSTTEGGRQVATRLAVSVDFAAHDFDPCSEQLCGRQSFEDRRASVTSTATRTG